ncbi:hypothetical protein PIB30_008486 [Stylosanthes scabra]|uniref:Uncharacterized protein n=1 Tax=Stylosanthes scabra TaxID=79078 RepID=A0ABU6Y506_9FABA|nr:hypothetical protein [Stylosanthes scabra]
MEIEGGSLKSRRSDGGAASENSVSTQGFLMPNVERIGMASPPNASAEPMPFYTTPRLVNISHCKFFMWLDKHCAEEVNDYFAVMKVENRVTVLENRVAAMEKRIIGNMWIVVASVIALLVAVYVFEG